MPSYRILIVEDQREVSRLLRSALETLEFMIEVVEIPSGEEAILDSSRNRVDLLVTDYRLPGITGIELMVKVRKFHPQVKVILITGLTDPKVRKEIAQAGGDAFFIKPVAIADFLKAVERHLGLEATSLPPKKKAADDEIKVQHTLPVLLANLRQELEATAVLVLNDGGHVMARAGDLPGSINEVSLISSLLSIYSAGQKVSRLVGQKDPPNWFLLNDGKVDLVFSPAGSTHAMLVMGKGLTEEKRMLKTLDAFSLASNMIKEIIAENTTGTLTTSEPQTIPGESNKKTATEMEPLLEEARKKTKATDLNEYWDNAAKKHKAPAKPDMLSYDQARQIGLAPEDQA
jgi:CheY-like chemotaxis protein